MLSVDTYHLERLEHCVGDLLARHQCCGNSSNDGTSGIYNNAANSIIFYTSSTTASTIDSSQCLYGSGTGLTNIGYSNVINKPTNFQSDWNSTIINKPTNFQSDWNSKSINQPDLTVYSTNTKVDALSTYSK